MLKNLLAEVIDPEEISKVYSAFDMIGDIIIIKIPECLTSKKGIIAKTLLQNVKSAKTVFAQTSAVTRDYRIRDLEFLAGENKTVTEYKEHGCRFKVDVARTYFSPRLSTERWRIANMVSDNEVITNMFAGVGTFSILIAKTNKTCKIYSIDSNPMANELSIINIKLNKLQENVIPICGDAIKVIDSRLKGQADRILMPLPERAKEFVDSAVSGLREKRGIVHYFAHVKACTKKLGLKQGISETEQAFKNYQYKILETRVIREVGPRMYQIVSDVSINND